MRDISATDTTNSAACSTYPPSMRRIALRGFEKVVIISTWGGASEFPTITIIAIGMQAYRAFQ
jgi:hypothetical protein